MQTREELYERLNYHSFEEKLDELFTRKEQGEIKMVKKLEGAGLTRSSSR